MIYAGRFAGSFDLETAEGLDYDVEATFIVKGRIKQVTQDGTRTGEKRLQYVIDPQEVSVQPVDIIELTPEECTCDHEIGFLGDDDECPYHWPDKNRLPDVLLTLDGEPINTRSIAPASDWDDTEPFVEPEHIEEIWDETQEFEELQPVPPIAFDVNRRPRASTGRSAAENDKTLAAFINGG